MLRIHHAAQGKVYPLTPGARLRIGRGANNEIRIQDMAVSTSHAVINDGVIEDVGSTNGTSINDRPLPKGERRVLQPGDIIQLGESRLAVLPAESAKPEAGAEEDEDEDESVDGLNDSTGGVSAASDHSASPDITKLLASIANKNPVRGPQLVTPTDYDVIKQLASSGDASDETRGGAAGSAASGGGGGGGAGETIDSLREKLRAQERKTKEALSKVAQLQRKLDPRRLRQDRAEAERKLHEKIQDLEFQVFYGTEVANREDKQRIAELERKIQEQAASYVQRVVVAPKDFAKEFQEQEDSKEADELDEDAMDMSRIPRRAIANGPASPLAAQAGKGSDSPLRGASAAAGAGGGMSDMLPDSLTPAVSPMNTLKESSPAPSIADGFPLQRRKPLSGTLRRVQSRVASAGGGGSGTHANAVSLLRDVCNARRARIDARSVDERLLPADLLTAVRHLRRYLDAPVEPADLDSQLGVRALGDAALALERALAQLRALRGADERERVGQLVQQRDAARRELTRCGEVFLEQWARVDAGALEERCSVWLSEIELEVGLGSLANVSAQQQQQQQAAAAAGAGSEAQQASANALRQSVERALESLDQWRSRTLATATSIYERTEHAARAVHDAVGLQLLPMMVDPNAQAVDSGPLRHYQAMATALREALEQERNETRPDSFAPFDSDAVMRAVCGLYAMLQGVVLAISRARRLAAHFGGAEGALARERAWLQRAPDIALVEAATRRLKTLWRREKRLESLLCDAELGDADEDAAAAPNGGVSPAAAAAAASGGGGSFGSVHGDDGAISARGEFSVLSDVADGGDAASLAVSPQDPEQLRAALQRVRGEVAAANRELEALVDATAWEAWLGFPELLASRGGVAAELIRCVESDGLERQHRSLQHYAEVTPLPADDAAGGGGGGGGHAFLAVEASGARHVLKEFRVARREERARLLSEARLLRRLAHPCVVDVEAVFFDKDGSLGYVELPHHARGTLAEWAQAAQLTDLDKKRVLFHVAAGLAHLHAHGVVHCDVRPRSVLIAADGGARLGEFDLARDAAQRTAAAVALMGATPKFMAPELLEDGARATPAADMFAFGVLASTLFLPDAQHSPTRLSKRASAASLPSAAAAAPTGAAPAASPAPSAAAAAAPGDGSLSELVTRLLSVDPATRPAAREVLSHPFFADVAPTLNARETELRELARRLLDQTVDLDEDRRVWRDRLCDLRDKRQSLAASEKENEQLEAWSLHAGVEARREESESDLQVDRLAAEEKELQGQFDVLMRRGAALRAEWGRYHSALLGFSAPHLLPPRWALRPLRQRGLSALVDVTAEFAAPVEEMIATALDGGGGGGGGGGTQRAAVARVERLENVGVWREFSFVREWLVASSDRRWGSVETRTARESMWAALGVASHVNECLLFHAPDAAALGPIASLGLDALLAAQRAGFHGLAFSEALRGPLPPVLLLCRVLLGNSSLVTAEQAAQLKRAPCVEIGDEEPPKRDVFHSLVVKGDHGQRTFVIHDPKQCYPEFIITLKPQP